MPVRIKHRGLPSILRPAALLLLFLLVILIAGSVVYNLKDRTRQPRAVNNAPQSARTYHEKFQALDFSGQKVRLSLKADHFSLDEDGRQYLEGKVEIVDQEAAGGVRLQADKMVLDPEKKLARAEGEASLVSTRFRLKAQDFEYDLKNKVARAGPARLEGEGLGLSAGRLVYSGGDGKVELEGDVAGEIKLAGETLWLSSRHLIIASDGLSFSAGGLKLKAGWMTFDADSARLGLKENGSALDFVSLEGGARARYEFQAGESEFHQMVLLSDRLLFQAGREVSVLRAPEAFEAEGWGDEWQMSGRGEGLEFLSAESRAASCLKADRFVSSLKDSAGDEFRLAGQKVDYNLTSGLLRINGQAEADHRHFCLKSDRLEFRLEDRSWLASTFSLEIRPGFFKLPPLFFDRESCLYLSGGQLSGGEDFFDLNSQVRIWQDEGFCQTERASLQGKSGRVLLEKLKRASWLVERADGRRERLKISADRADLQSEESRAVLTGKVELSLGHLSLAANELTLSFSVEAPGRLMRGEARGRVAFSWKGYRASGRQAGLDFATEKLTLTGFPQLLTADGERLEADKLTLYMADDRIGLENQKRERSLTIVVRGK